MRSTYRNRPNHRSTAVCIISALLLLALLVCPCAANSAEYYLSDDGKTLSVSAELTQQSTFTLVKPGFLDDEPLVPTEFSIKDETGGNVEYTVSKSVVSFPQGNYTITFTQPVSDNLIYAKYPDFYDAKVYLPEKYTTGHLILGTVSSNGVISPSDKEGYAHLITCSKTKTIEVKFYEDGREFWLYGFIAIWAIVLLIVYARYRTIKNRRKNAGRLDK